MGDVWFEGVSAAKVRMIPIPILNCHTGNGRRQ